MPNFVSFCGYYQCNVKWRAAIIVLSFYLASCFRYTFDLCGSVIVLWTIGVITIDRGTPQLLHWGTKLYSGWWRLAKYRTLLNEQRPLCGLGDVIQYFATSTSQVQKERFHNGSNVTCFGHPLNWGKCLPRYTNNNIVLKISRFASLVRKISYGPSWPRGATYLSVSGVDGEKINWFPFHVLSNTGPVAVTGREFAIIY